MPVGACGFNTLTERLAATETASGCGCGTLPSNNSSPYRPISVGLIGGGFRPESMAVLPLQCLAVLGLEQVAVFTGIRTRAIQPLIAQHGVITLC